MKKFLAFLAFALIVAGCGGNKHLANAIRADDQATINQRLTSQNINAPLNKNVTPLMFAIRTGASMETIKDMVAKGADINWQNQKRQDPIYYSVYYNRLDVLKYLVGLNAKSVNSQDVLESLARKKGYPQILEYVKTLKF